MEFTYCFVYCNNILPDLEYVCVYKFHSQKHTTWKDA